MKSLVYDLIMNGHGDCELNLIEEDKIVLRCITHNVNIVVAEVEQQII